jgi:ABC-type bacteriocin/lantibiotic exporter with double-glycine peptidase domain
MMSDKFYTNLINYFDLINYSKKDIIFLLLGAVLFLFVFKLFYTLYAKYQNSQYVYNIRCNLSEKLFRKYLNNDYNFYLNNNSSTLLRNIDSIVNNFSAYVNVLQNFFLEITFLILVFFSGIYFTTIPTILVFFISIFFFIIYLKIYKNKFLAFTNKKLILEASSIKKILEAFSSIKELIIHRLQNNFLLDFQKINQVKNNLGYKIDFLSSLPKILFEFFTLVLIIFFISILLFFKIPENEIIFQMSIFGLFAFKVIPSISRIVSYNQSLLSFLPSLHILTKEIAINENINSQLKKEIFIKKKVEIRDFNLSFNNKKLINKSYIVFEKNKINSITGGSGSGKTSIANFLSGLIKNNKAKVYLDNNLIDYKNFFYKISIIGKDNFILDGTIKENVIFKEKYNKNLFKKACSAADIYTFINSLKNKENFKTSEKGFKLSDGQKQRIFIARALYKNPSILIFDEATNSLDKKSEENIIKTIIKLKKYCIIIFISHDIKLVKKISDVIYFVDQNKKKIKIIN